MITIVLSILLIIIILAFATWRGHISWTQYIRTQIQKINTSHNNKIEYVNLDEVSNLPEPVRRYFHLAINEGAAFIKHAFISQTGGFRTNPNQNYWYEMQAEQSFSTIPRGFVWISSISMLPGLSVNVCDSYIEGIGKMKGKILSLFTLIDSKNQKQLNEAALQRYLAEAVWFPTALLPSQGVTWIALSNHTAKAMITDSGITASLEFEFNKDGEIVSVYSPARFRSVKGQYIVTPWKGQFSRYIRINDYLIPQHGEVEWHLENQVYPYWKADLTQIRYE